MYSPDFLACTYASMCSGCDWLLKPAHEQRALKIEALKTAWGTQASMPDLGQIGWVDAGHGGLRDRVDLMIDRRDGAQKIGLFDRFRTGLVDLQGCPQLSPRLEQWFKDFRRYTFPITRGSVRLRVSPNGEQGVWLDFANVEIKSLLDERITLDHLRSDAIVEIGQKRKRLVERDGQLKLSDPVLEPWFETYLGDSEKAVPLYTTIGSFTQPGFKANRALIKETMRLVRTTGANRIAEFGSGIGNFTLPLADFAQTVDAYEVDTLALEGMAKSLAEQNLSERVTIHSGNYQGAKASGLSFAGVDLLLFDPPRSGLMQFLEPLEKMAKPERPRHLIYISCFAESFAVDAARLLAMGYETAEMSIVDQFPQSRHFEIVARFDLRV